MVKAAVLVCVGFLASAVLCSATDPLKGKAAAAKALKGKAAAVHGHHKTAAASVYNPTAADAYQEDTLARMLNDPAEMNKLGINKEEWDAGHATGAVQDGNQYTADLNPAKDGTTALPGPTPEMTVSDEIRDEAGVIQPMVAPKGGPYPKRTDRIKDLHDDEAEVNKLREAEAAARERDHKVPNKPDKSREKEEHEHIPRH